MLGLLLMFHRPLVWRYHHSRQSNVKVGCLGSTKSSHQNRKLGNFSLRHSLTESNKPRWLLLYIDFVLHEDSEEISYLWQIHLTVCSQQLYALQFHTLQRCNPKMNVSRKCEDWPRLTLHFPSQPQQNLDLSCLGIITLLEQVVYAFLHHLYRIEMRELGILNHLCLRT